jgi:uncharacterized protein (DUF1330 family)
MAAYLIAQIKVTDPEAYKKYTSEVPETIERYGGKFLVRGGTVTTVEGDWHPERLVVVEFPNMKTLEKWYRSDDYQKILQYRLDASEGDVIFVEGS